MIDETAFKVLVGEVPDRYDELRGPGAMFKKWYRVTHYAEYLKRTKWINERNLEISICDRCGKQFKWSQGGVWREPGRGFRCNCCGGSGLWFPGYFVKETLVYLYWGCRNKTALQWMVMIPPLVAAATYYPLLLLIANIR